ncbi:MAG: glycosyltransferase [Patescibacteria group bacterium]
MIAILIVGYNSKKDLPDCLESIYSSSYKDFQVFFVDNSNDGSSDYLKKNFPKVEVIENSDNLGYAGGNNLLMKLAAPKADYFFLLNADTIIDKDCLKKLAEHADQKTILQPLLLLHRNGQKTDLINTDGNYLNFLGFSYCGNLGKKYATDYRLPTTGIPLASGAAMFLPVGVYKKIGDFDQSYFIYHEDADLSIRARVAGYDIKLIESAILWHKYSFSKHKSKFYYAERNRLKFLLKNFSFKYLALIFPAFVVTELMMILYALIGGWVIEKFKGYGDVIKTMSATLSERKKILKLKKIKDSELKRVIGPWLTFSELRNPLLFVYNIFLVLWWYLIYIFI